MYLHRTIEPNLLEGLQHSPVVALIGPRQCGKSTLAKQMLSNRTNSVYLDLELPSDLAKLNEAEWFLRSQSDRLVCIDEIQRKPELFPLLRSLTDQYGENGKFLVLGSASRELLGQSSESLAGRIRFERLTPLLWCEVSTSFTLESYLVRGGFPRSLLSTGDSASLRWRNDFISTFLERELLQWHGFSTSTMLKLWQMLAYLNGQTVNFSTLAGSLGVSHTTVRNYIDLLASTFLIEVLSGYQEKSSKRLVRAPKVYIADSGIVTALLRINSFQNLAGHPVLGSLWEGLVLTTLKACFPEQAFSYYRTGHGAEIDIILTRGSKHIVVECKISLSPVPTRGFYSALEDIKPEHSFIVAPVAQPWPIREGIDVVNLTGVIERIRMLLSKD
jgi:uncharacterized protein